MRDRQQRLPKKIFARPEARFRAVSTRADACNDSVIDIRPIRPIEIIRAAANLHFLKPCIPAQRQPEHAEQHLHIIGIVRFNLPGARVVFPFIERDRDALDDFGNALFRKADLSIRQRVPEHRNSAMHRSR